MLCLGIFSCIIETGRQGFIPPETDDDAKVPMGMREPWEG